MKMITFNKSNSGLIGRFFEMLNAPDSRVVLLIFQVSKWEK